MIEKSKNEYEKKKVMNLGYQVSVSKIFTKSVENMWELILSEKGISVWLGDISIEDFEIQKPFISKEGIEGKLTVFVPNCHLRLKWKPKHWDYLSTVELRITSNKGRAAIIFHQTGFYEFEKREEMRNYWKGIINNIDKELSY